jgi:hypothetical protein
MGSIAIIEAKNFRSEAERESVALNPTPAAGDSSLAHHTSSYICYRSIVRQCVSMRPRPRDSTFGGKASYIQAALDRGLSWRQFHGSNSASMCCG